MKAIRSALTLGAVVGVFAVSAAQTSEPIGLSARGGLFIPTAREARDAGNAWLALGLEYKFQEYGFGQMNPGYSSYFSLSLDYMGQNDFSHIPLLVNYVGRNDQIFYSLGAGLGLARTPRATGSESSTELALQIGVGYDFASGPTPAFVEAKYFFSGDDRLQGYGLFAGVRF